MSTLTATPITHKTMLCKVYIGQWTAQKQDKRATREVVEQHHADADSGTFYKTLLKSGALDCYRKNGDAARIFLYSRTMPWKEGGSRLMPSMLFDDVSVGMSKFGDKAEEFLEEFLGEYADARDKAKTSLGSLFDANDYPPVNVIRGKFSYNVSYEPVPEAGNWLVDLEREQIEELSSQRAKDLENATAVAMRDLWIRLHQTVEHIHERLSDDTKTFRNSLVGNLEDLVDLLPKLNFTDDPDLNRMAAEAKLKLGGHDVEGLRKDNTFRKDVAEEADKLLKQMNPYMKKAFS